MGSDHGAMDERLTYSDAFKAAFSFFLLFDVVLNLREGELVSGERRYFAH